MKFLPPTFALAALALICAAAPASAAARQPNVVYLLADDLGWGDLSRNGGKIPTPAIDKLFARGVELNTFMGWCVCSPTRAMLLTGRHPFRVGTGPEVGGELAAEEITIAEGFKANGYRTGVFGKWHNGDDPDTTEYRAAFAEAWKSMPNKKLKGGLGANAHGFDEAWVYYGGGADYFNRRTVQGRGPVSWWHNREFRPQDAGYTEDLITRHALEFIGESKDTPFFCYVPFHLVHAPLQAKDDDLAEIEPTIGAALPAASPKATTAEKRTHAAMLRALDKNVAAIVAELDRLGLTENTILVFTSDNGAMEAGSSLPLRGAKHTIYDGGVRLPTVVHWPKGGLIGGTRWDGLCGALDMFPTLIAMTDSKMPATRPLDGRNLWPALRARTESPVESYYWAWHGQDALRTVQWKLHRYYDRFELYDIRKDESEMTNVADANPAVVQSLVLKMNAWTDSLHTALSHTPAPMAFDAKPAPEGDVLEVTVTVTAEAKPKDRLIVPIASWDGFQQATDWVEFDLATAPGALPRGFFYSPFQGNDSKSMQVFFKRGDGIDQFGREQAAGPEIRGGAGVWEHRVVGMSSTAPGPLGRHGLVFSGGTPGTYTVYVDNLRIRRVDGSVSSLWSDRSQTRTQKIMDSAAFKNIRVRTVPLGEVKARS